MDCAYSCLVCVRSALPETRLSPTPAGLVGFLDAEGFLNIVGRASEAIPGARAHPRIVEEAAHAHPELKECALVAVGGEPVLACSARRGASLTAAKVEKALEGELDPASRPARVVVIDGDLPRSAAGKVLRGGVAQSLAGRTF